MAVKKSDLDKRLLAEKIGDWESKIDDALDIEYDGSDAEIVIPLDREEDDEHIGAAVAAELVERYRKAGWTLTINNPTDTTDGAITVVPLLDLEAA